MSLMLNVELTVRLIVVVARVDKYAEIEYSMVSTPTVSSSSVDLSLKVKTFSVNVRWKVKQLL